MLTISELLFYVVILLANIIQGITGFAGTILAMPFSIMLVGYDVAKPVLNVLGLLSGIYVFVGNRRHVNRRELGKIALIMAAGIAGGIGIKYYLTGNEWILYRALGIFVILLAVEGLYRQVGLYRKERLEARSAAGNLEAVTDAEDGQAEAEAVVQNGAGQAKPLVSWRGFGEFLLLAAAGIVHGIFVSGGPLLIGYLSKKISDKTAFRATISTVWIFLNSMILVSDIGSGLWNAELLYTQAISVPFLLAGMFIGSKLYAVMSQRLFMVITYVLLFISGGTLLFK